ncbi:MULTISPECIES: hypothetical protein [unclassified Streptomyces]|uniref:hypothetical protein n=1 Tax=unclassified Streptomyces TaxID=2593676 RepID=UPI0004BDA141|nr:MULTISPECIES: hypothetical protein [unclassified Streptomyces]
MSQGIYFHLRLRFRTREGLSRWQEQALLAQRARLAPVPGFAGIDMGDDDLLGGEPRRLPRNATVGDLLAHVRSELANERGFVEILTNSADADADAGAVVAMHGFLPDYDSYRDHRLPMIYAGAAASRLGGEGTVSFLGPADGEYVVTFADFADSVIRISEPDPQDLRERELTERFGGIAVDDVYRAWKAR